MPVLKTLFVGIDVGKAALDVAIAGTHFQVPNSCEGHADLLAKVKALGRRLHFIIEHATGYDRDLINYLHTKRCKVSLVNAYRVRSFARASGCLAKTDRLDAQILSDYGRTFRPAPSAKADKLQQQLRHVMRGDLRCLAAEARGNVIGKRCDFRIGIGAAKRRHRDGILRRQPPGAGKHHLDDICPAGIVDRQRAAERGKG